MLNCLNFGRWCQLFGSMLRFEECSVLSVSYVETKMCSDVCVWLVLSAWNVCVVAYIKHEVNFVFPVQKYKEDGCHFLHLFLLLILRTFSPQCHSHRENGCIRLCKPVISVKLTSLKTPLRGLEDHLYCCTNLLCVRHAGRVTTILSHPYLSPNF